MFGFLGSDAPSMPAAGDVAKENELLRRENAKLKAALGKSPSSAKPFFGSSAPSPPPRPAAPLPSRSPPKAPGPSSSPQKPSPSKPSSSKTKSATSGDEAPEDFVIVVGDILEVCGLEQHADYNGREARVAGHDPLKGTWHVLIDGTTKKVALRSENLKPGKNYKAPGDPLLQGAANRRAQKTVRSKTARMGGDGSNLEATRQSGALVGLHSSASAGQVKRRHMQTARGSGGGGRKLTKEEREAALARLYAHKQSWPAISKFETPEKAPEVDPFDPYSSQLGTDGKQKAIDDRPPFVVPIGRRRKLMAAKSQRAQSGEEEAVRPERIQPRTYRGSPTTMTALNRTAWKGKTTSPSGKGHPDRDRRNEVRNADMHTNINYYATMRDMHHSCSSTDASYTAPDNDRKMKEASFLTSQAWFESLRHYPSGPNAIDSEAAYSGLTHGPEVPSEHLETDVRTRLGIAAADPDWQHWQLQEAWAPDKPDVARRVVELRSKLRGVSTDDPTIAAAGDPSGPDLWDRTSKSMRPI